MLFSRKDFIKVTVLACVSFILDSCGIEQEDEHQKANTSPKGPKQGSKVVFKKKDSDHVYYVTEGNSEFEKLRIGFSKRINHKPLVIAVCLNAKGVQEAFVLAKEHDLRISIKSGGHCFEGFSSNNDGLVINLSRMNHVELINENEVSVGAGCTLEKLYSELLPHNKIIPAGSCGGVGVSGLTLGGGYGFFSREYGLTCDNLLEVEMVNSKGEIIKVDQDSDLLWALKGAGNGNFGVVTNLVYKTHAAPEFFQSNRFKSFKLDVARAKQLLEKWMELAAKLPNYCFSAFVLNGKSLTILVTSFREMDVKTITLLNEITALSDLTKMGGKTPLKAALKVFEGHKEPTYFKNASVGLYDGYSDLENISDEVIKNILEGHGLIFQINTLGGNINSEEFAVASCFPHRKALFLSELQCYWEKKKNSDERINRFKEVQSIFLEAGLKRQYVNYPALENENYESAYYGENIDRLKKLKTKYDPSNSFSHPQSIIGA